MPAFCSAAKVPPVDSRATLRAASARANSTRPVLSETDSKARRMGLVIHSPGYPLGALPSIESGGRRGRVRGQSVGAGCERRGDAVWVRGGGGAWQRKTGMGDGDRGSGLGGRAGIGGLGLEALGLGCDGG